jgi:DNA-binding LytR/AlgR family response regulator
MNKARVVIVEDEALIADHIEELLLEASFDVVGVFDHAEAVFDFFATQTADIVLLDINLNGSLDGVDIAHQLNKTAAIPIVFLTSNVDKRTIDRVKLTTPAGFVTKPFTREEIVSNLEIVLYKWGLNAKPVAEELPDSFMVKDKNVLIKVAFGEILFAEAMDNYAIIYLSDKKYILPHTLKSVFDLLEPHGFIKTHRSFVVNASKIKAIHPKSVIVEQKEVPLSENLRAEVLARFARL